MLGLLCQFGRVLIPPMPTFLVGFPDVYIFTVVLDLELSYMYACLICFILLVFFMLFRGLFFVIIIYFLAN